MCVNSETHLIGKHAELYNNEMLCNNPEPFDPVRHNDIIFWANFLFDVRHSTVHIFFLIIGATLK
ncbi:MAG TPA: hypothetical protein DCY53_09045 [Desulfobacteraceae bacterium]|nr:hypothetical protein [Desulfobacteraceae bacterium]